MHKDQASHLSRRRFSQLAAGVAGSGLAGVAAPASLRINISSKRLSEVPIERTIFGHFVEAGFGRQVEGMWSELIYNRSFQSVPPYSRWTWDWLGLVPEAYNSKAPFWHSGYEEIDWELISPRNSSKQRTLGTETYKGNSALTLAFDGGSSTGGGLRQRGIYIKAGETYDFRIMGSFAAPRTSKETQTVRIMIRPENDPMQVIGEATFLFETNAKEFRWEFANPRFTGRVSLDILFQRRGTIRLSWCSLMPRSSVHGWRSDVIALLKQIQPQIIRFPGGCYASFHDWKRAIGPRSERPPEESYYWGGLDENDVGIDEFLDLCHEIRCEPQICVNMMTSNAFDAADLVEYCNGDDRTRMGRRRVRYGVMRRNRVTYWEMDNEVRRKWSSAGYARQIVEYSAAMKEVDPAIKIMMESYSYGPELLPEMLEIAGKSIDIVITRSSDLEQLNTLLNIIRRYNAQAGTKLRLANTEWLALHRDVPEADPEIPPMRRALGTDYRGVKSFHQIHWFYALNTARILMNFIAAGGELCSTNFNNAVNTWGQSIIEASKEGAWLSPVGKVYEHINKLGVRFPLETALEQPEGTFLSAQAAETSYGRGIDVLVVNQGRKEVRAELMLPAGYRAQSIDVIHAPSRLSRTSLGNSDIQVATDKPDGGGCVFRPLSVSIVHAAKA
jgi:hypothetical protein